MPITNDALRAETVSNGSRRHLRDRLTQRHPRNIAFFVSESNRGVYYSRKSEGDPLPAIVKLFLCGVHTSNEIGRVYRNYHPPTDADVGIVALCGGYFYRDDGLSSANDLVALIDGDFRNRHFNEVSTRGLPALVRGDFPLYGAASPGIDLTRENPGTPNTHDGFHTVHRLYMAAAYRVLRAMQATNGREGVAALLVDNTGKILAWGLKNPAHPALHAEFSAILAYGRRLPAGVRLYSTLKPCRMCAGLVTTLSDGGHRVFYGQDDPTTAAQDTFLDADHSSSLLNGRRHLPGVRGIVPIYGDNRRSHVTLAEMLADEYDRTGGSIINFATSPDARAVYNRSDRMLDAKIAKYADGARNDRNRNVWAALSYLTGFLNHINVPTTPLAPPP